MPLDYVCQKHACIYLHAMSNDFKRNECLALS